MTWRERILHWLGVDATLAAHQKNLVALNQDNVDHNTRLLELRDAVVKLETKPAEQKPDPEPFDAGSWSRKKLRASMGQGQDAA